MLQQDASTDGETKTKYEKLVNYIEKAKSSGQRLHFYEPEVKHIRIAKMWNGDYKKVEINIKDGSEADQIMEIIYTLVRKDRGFKDLPGVAPPGDLEAKLQQWLTDIGESQNIKS